MNNAFFYNRSLVHIAIIAIPFLSFVNNNIHDLDLIVLRSSLIIFILTVTSIFLVSRLLEFFYRKISYKLYAFFLSFGFFLLFQFYTLLRDIIFIYIPIVHSNIAFVLIILIFIIFFIFSYIKENKFITNFILIYLSVSFLLSFSITLLNLTKVISQDLFLNKNLYQEKKDKQTTSNIQKNNMYFIIVDAAVSIKKFDEFYNTNYSSSYLPKLKNLGFSYVHNTRSAYNDTKYSIASLFYMKYQINFENYKKYSTSNIYPIIMQKYRAGNLPLIKNLNTLGYNFKWIGTAWHNCEYYNPDFCFESKNSYLNTNLISLYVVNTFLQRSPIIPLYHRINNLLTTKVQQEPNYAFKKNDAIGNFLKKIENTNLNKNNFFFLHLNMPHQPYLYESDCSKNKNKNFKNIYERSMMGYRKNYECMLNRVLAFAEYINKYDPQANVIISSDHGEFLFNNTTDKEEIIANTYNNFTLIKINKECKKYLNRKLNIPNEIRLLLSCSNDLAIELLEPKSYYVTWEHPGTFGTKLKLDEIKSITDGNFNAEVLLKMRNELDARIKKLKKVIINPTKYTYYKYN